MTTINRTLDTAIGPRFLSISNADLLTMVRNATASFGVEGQAVRVVGNDRRMTALATLKGLAFEVPGDGTLVPRLFFHNDNTGRKALSIGVGLFRLICSNGLTVGVPGMSFEAKLRHVDGPRAHEQLDILPAMVAEAVQFIEAGGLLDQIDAAKETKVTEPIEVVASLPIGIRAKEQAIDWLAHAQTRKEDNPYTAWGLYNTVNEAVRLRSRNEFTALAKDEGLLSHIITLAAA